MWAVVNVLMSTDEQSPQVFWAPAPAMLGCGCHFIYDSLTVSALKAENKLSVLSLYPKYLSYIRCLVKI